MNYAYLTAIMDNLRISEANKLQSNNQNST